MAKVTKEVWGKTSVELEAKYTKAISKAIEWMDTLEWNDKAFQIITVNHSGYIGMAASENAMWDCKTEEEMFTTETLEIYEASLEAICADIQKAFEQR
jgi:hypothetical protein